MRIGQDYAARAAYLPEYHDGTHRLLVAVTCRIGELPFVTRALLDTGSEWCVLPGSLARRLGCDLAPTASMPRLHTRFGMLAGRLERISMTFVPEEGEPVETDATWFVSPDWPGPTVIGWKGCLERMRFALDPTDDSFYFAEL
jgi:hypothetical protein